MAKGILGRKLGMTQVFDEKGSLTPVTVIEAGPCTIVQKKTVTSDGYVALQLGFGTKRERLFNKPAVGHFKKVGATPVRYLKEIRLNEGDELAQLEAGQQVTAVMFSDGELVDVTGVSKGKGFAGVIKRHGMHRGPMTHGSMYHRRPGSLGATDPQRVFKGRRLPGRHGGLRRTIPALRVVRVDADRNLLLIRGSVPGPKGALLLVRSSYKQPS